MEICVCHFLLQVRVSMGTERKREDEFDLYFKKKHSWDPKFRTHGESYRMRRKLDRSHKRHSLVLTFIREKGI